MGADSDAERVVLAVDAASDQPQVLAEVSAPVPAWLLPAAGVLAVSTLLGAALAPSLARDHPLWLIALNPWPRHLILVAPHSPAVPFIVLATVRGFCACVVAYALGRQYGAGATSALAGGSTRGARTFRLAQRLFGSWSPVLLVVFPGLTTSALAGMSGLQRRRAWSLSLLGLLLWACINYRLGALLSPWTAPIVRFLSDNMLAATLVCSAAVLIYQFAVRKKDHLQ